MLRNPRSLPSRAGACARTCRPSLSPSLRISTRWNIAPAPAAAPVVPDVYSVTDDPQVVAYQDHQKSAARPSAAEAAKTMLTLAKFGVLSTNSQMSETEGYPLGSVVEFATSEDGKPVFSVSTISPHTKGMADDGRICLTVQDTGFNSLKDSRFSLQGKVRRVTAEEQPALREAFLKKFPDAFYVDFGDFQWFIMDELKAGRYNGGFGALKKVSATDYLAAKPDPIAAFSVLVSAADYLAAKPDPIAAFSAPVCSHMNGDHVADTIAMIKHYVGLDVEDAKLTELDRLGMNCMVTRKGTSFKLRLPFATPAEDRKGIKNAIVEMTKAARVATPKEQSVVPSGSANRGTSAEDQKAINNGIVEMTKAARVAAPEEA
eukprot:gene9214-16358_t